MANGALVHHAAESDFFVISDSLRQSFVASWTENGDGALAPHVSWTSSDHRVILAAFVIDMLPTTMTVPPRPMCRRADFSDANAVVMFAGFRGGISRAYDMLIAELHAAEDESDVSRMIIQPRHRRGARLEPWDVFRPLCTLANPTLLIYSLRSSPTPASL
ncbi:hypothetical protein M885DRAFT_581063 [Pelagophyceae sp. CCMP2097]|nr:hypothetical protein M885DRAFT_581063 [Pelagophyceae sp. CCMP2097]